MKICLVMDSLERRRQSHEEIKNIVEHFDVPLVLVDESYQDESVFNKSLGQRLITMFHRLWRGRFSVVLAVADALAARLCAYDRNGVFLKPYQSLRQVKLFSSLLKNWVVVATTFLRKSSIGFTKQSAIPLFWKDFAAF